MLHTYENEIKEKKEKRMKKKDFDKIYYDLTGVDIEEQKGLWDERGKGYYGEYLVFRDLFRHIYGAAKFLMNVEIPVNAEQTTELDLIMIHETGLYVFEIKHYVGTIYGNDNSDMWLQFLKTRKNNSFKNPIKQNEYHVKALQKMFPKIPIHSIIVFTQENCILKVNTKKHVYILDEMLERMYEIINKQKFFIEIDQIEEIFKKLECFSPNNQCVVNPHTGEVIPFFKYVHELYNMYTETMEFNDRYKREMQSKYRKKWFWISVCTIFICLITVLIR